MGVVSWVILGLVAGVTATAVQRSTESRGMVKTLAVGVLGAVVGGVIASAVGVGGIGSFFNLGAWLIAIGGALLTLVIYSTLAAAGGGRSRHTAA